MKHAVLPTDFSIRSLHPIHEVLHHYRNEEIKITLLHLLAFPTGIGDLLFRNMPTKASYQQPPAFTEACEIMANRYAASITSITPLLRYGSSVPFLENLLAGIRADAVFVQPGFQEALPFSDSVRLLPLISRCNFSNIIEAPRSNGQTSLSGSTVSDLLLARV